MDSSWDDAADLVVGGTGVAALAAAITAADAGLTVLMLESTDRWGGSSAMSGGGLWLPNNPLMRRDGVGDSREEALAYLEATVGDAGPATSRERKEAFVDGVADFVDLAERLGVRFARATDYPDYYPERAGGKIGRALEVEPFDVRRIGEWWATSRGQDGVPAPVKTDDFWLLSRAWSTRPASPAARGWCSGRWARWPGGSTPWAWARRSPRPCWRWRYDSACACSWRPRWTNCWSRTAGSSAS